MSRCQIAIAADVLSAEMVLAPGGAIGESELAAALRDAGVVHGIDAAALRDLAVRSGTNPVSLQGVVARGTAARDGVDARVEFVHPIGALAGTESADGTIDYRERALLHPVHTGDVLAKCSPATPGEPGRDVRGRDLPAKPGKPDKLRTGAGAERRGDTVVALTDGVVLAVPDKSLDVVALHVHQGDVDLHSGNLRTHGSLRVRGDVKERFEVQAAADVVIDGAVLDGIVHAGGSVQVAEGVLGEHALATAGGDLECRHVTAANLQAEGLVRIRDQVGHCRVRGTSIHVHEGRGRVVGGELRARSTVLVGTAGTAAGARTLLAVADLTDAQGENVRRDHAAGQLERLTTRARRGEIDRGAKAGRQLVRQGDAALGEKLRVAQQQRELLASARIEIHGDAWPGVRIQFGPAGIELEHAVHGVRYRWDDTNSRIVEEPR